MVNIPKSIIILINPTTYIVASIGALVGVVGVMAIPIAAPLTGAVVAVGTATAAYGIIRSTMNLVDRGTHEQVRLLFSIVSGSGKRTTRETQQRDRSRAFHNSRRTIELYYV